MRTHTKSASIVGSELKDKIEIGQTTSQIAQWYYTLYHNRSRYHKSPPSLPVYKESHPYYLTIHRLQGLPVSKKSGNSNLFINLRGMFVTEKFEILGIPFNYQFQESMTRSDSKWEVPFQGYFHSRIDKNYEDLYLLIQVQVLQIRDSIVEVVTHVGTMVIKSPFLQEENKVVPILKDLNFVQFGFMPLDAKKKLLSATSSITAQYSVDSVLELKKSTKMVPQNTIFTHQDSISGLKGGCIPRDNPQLVLKEASSVQITVVFLQIHISQKFQQDLVAYMKRMYPTEKGLDIKNRKIVIGYYNQYTLTNPTSRKLEFLDKEIAGQMRVNIYESLKEGEVVKLPFYMDKNTCCGVIAVGLLYEVGQKEIEVACYYFLPTQKGEDISERMVTGLGFGAVHQMIEIPSTEKPTLLLEYECDFKQTQNTLKEQQLQLTSRDMSSRQMFDEEAISRQKERLKEQIQKQRLQILGQKQEMQKLKNQNYIQFQTEFQRKFQVEKQNLYKKQQMIQNQYKEQVEREIRERFELEDQIKKMTQKLKNIEDDNFKKITGSQNISNAEIHPGSPRFQPREEATSHQIVKQRMDPGYIIEPENTVPVKKVREIIEKGLKVHSQIMKISEEQFNYASKFTFSFLSIVWSNQINPPRNIYLVLRFFNQEEFTSDNLSYLQSGQSGYHQLVRTSHFSQGYESKEPTYSFTVDPSEYHQPHMLQKDLIAYLANNSAIIDVFCGQSHLYIGQINIKLKQLIRGTKSQTLIAKELNLVRLKDKEHLGVMQILIKNEQVVCKDEVSLKQMKKVKELTKKVVSNNPIFIPAQEKMTSTREKEHRGELIKSKGGNTTRQELRIQKYKEQKAMKTFTQTANGFFHLEENQKGVVLNQIINYKERKMDDFIKNVYANLLNEQINLTAHFGKAVTFPYLFQNTSQSSSAYKVSIMYVGDENEQELAVVKGSKEWRFFVAQHNYSEPKRYDMIGQNNTYFLHPGESIPLIFKFLSFKKEKKGNSSKERVINVTICKEDNNWIAGGFSLFVQMHEPIIHHSYILYEPGDQVVDIIVPVIYSQTDNTTTPKKIHLTDSNPSSTAQWLNPYEILVRVQTPKIMQKIKFNLLLYNDEYCCELTENWLIQIYAYEGVCSYFRSDFNTKFKITMPWSAVPAHLGLLSLDRASSSLKLYASSSALIFKQNIIEIDSDRRDEGGCEIWCELLGGENSRKSAEVTCVSGEDSELIYGWTVTVYPYVSRS